MSDPKIYFADLAAYNNGRLHGVWVEFYEGIEPEEVQFAIDFMLAKTDGEEWRIDSSEGFAGVESGNIERLCAVAELIHEHDEGAVTGYFEHLGQDANLEEFADYYLGCYESEADFCQEYLGLNEAAEKVEIFQGVTLAYYIDWEKVAKDLFIDSYWSYTEGYEKVHVYTR
jgi:antirestriction protein